MSGPREAPILLSPPDVGARERQMLLDALDSNWIAPLGPHVDQFEREFAAKVGVEAAHAVSSGTAALHLALRLLGISAGDDVFVSTLTFVGSVNPILYQGARPVFVDSEPLSWNMDPDLLEAELEARARRGRLPAAVVLVHVYGQSADLARMVDICSRFEVPLVEDAAEALGATHALGSPGTVGRLGIFSFNGNKVITTSGGGMIVSNDTSMVERARKLSAQARESTSHYEHCEVGYNYRLSNLLAAVGRAQLETLEDRVSARRETFRFYQDHLGSIPGVEFQPEAPWGRHSRWLTCLTIRPEMISAGPEEVRVVLSERKVESRRLWKPMHLQPVFRGSEVVGGAFSEFLFDSGLCLPSGSSMNDRDRGRVVEAFRGAIIDDPSGPREASGGC